MSEDREVSKGIVRNPRRLGGKPTIKGTRITAEMVANLAEGMTWDAIVDSYPSLAYTDIANARAWARRAGV